MLGSFLDRVGRLRRVVEATAEAEGAHVDLFGGEAHALGDFVDGVAIELELEELLVLLGAEACEARFAGFLGEELAVGAIVVGVGSTKGFEGVVVVGLAVGNVGEDAVPALFLLGLAIDEVAGNDIDPLLEGALGGVVGS